MERLTKKDGANRNFVDVKRFDDDEWIISEMADVVTIKFSSKAIDKLAEFEDFMEANKFEGIEELQKALNGEFEHIFDEKHKIWIKTIEDKTYVEKRNRILEERWQNLKEWLSIKWFAENADLSLGDVIRKIKELEKE